MSKADCEDIIKKSWELPESNEGVNSWLSLGDRCREELQARNSDPDHNPRLRIAKVKERLHQLTFKHQTAEVRADHAFLTLELERVYADLAV